MKNNNNGINTFIKKYIFLFIFINFQQIKSYLIFPLEFLPNENYLFFQSKINNNSPEKIIQQVYYNNLITKIKIGKEKKDHIFFIEANSNDFYISSINPPKISKNIIEKQNNYYTFPNKELFNEEKSLSYNENYCKEVMYNVAHFSEICYGSEQIVFNNEGNSLIKDFPIKITKNTDDNIPGRLGLLLNNTLFNYSRSLITELKSYNIINNYYWFLDIDDISLLNKKIKANLILGGLPHEIFPDKYSSENYRTKNTFTLPYIFEAWRFKFDKIYIEGNSILFENSFVCISYEFYHIIGASMFQERMKNLFMNNLIKEKKCFYSKFPQNLMTEYNMTFYYCYKSVKNILYENMPSLKFFSIDLSYIFELTKEELFYTKDDYIYFNILFCEQKCTYWTLGQIFTTKYNFVFNTDKKQIGFYQTNNETKKLNNIKNNNKLLIIFIIILCLIFICIGITLGKKIFGFRRKIIVNELIEEQNYDYRVNNDRKEISIESNYKPIGDKKSAIIEMTKKFD